MDAEEPAAFFLVGPTATGKTAAAQWIAERSAQDILSADAMLIYRGMDIGTAKPSSADRGRVRYFGIDLIEPDRRFSVWEFRRYACEAVAESLRQGRGLIVTGGTGLYVKGLTHGLAASPAPDARLREEWTRRLSEEGVAPLQEALRAKDVRVYESLADPRNPRRLMRAMELAESGRREGRRAWPDADAGVPLVGLDMEPTALKSRIESRVDAMYGTGFLEEVRALIAKYPRLSDTARSAIGYAEAIAVIEGALTSREARERTVRRTQRLAKRQRTWFRHQADVRWVRVEPDMPAAEAGARVLALWQELGPTRMRLES